MGDISSSDAEMILLEQPHVVHELLTYHGRQGMLGRAVTGGLKVSDLPHAVENKLLLPFPKRLPRLHQ